MLFNKVAQTTARRAPCLLTVSQKAPTKTTSLRFMTTQPTPSATPGFSATAPPKSVPRQSPKTMQKNALVAFVLLGFTGGVYYTAISKMRPEQDELGRIIDEMNPSSTNAATDKK